MGFKSVHFLFLALGLMSTTLLIDSCEGAGSFHNPILDLPNTDQYIYLHTDGFYYMTRKDGQDIYLYKSEALSNWRLAERKIIHTKNDTDTLHGQSEIHFLSGNWYVYFHAYNQNLSQHSAFVIEALNPDNPFSRYSDEIRLRPATLEEELDGTVLELNSGSLYFIYSGFDTQGTGNYKLFIAPMSNPTTISGPRTLIRETKSTWDTSVYSPQILRENKNGNQTFLTFIGGSEVYCLGLMEIDDGKDPLVAANWWHYPNGTVFASNPTTSVYNPTDASFTYSPVIRPIPAVEVPFVAPQPAIQTAAKRARTPAKPAAKRGPGRPRKSQQSGTTKPAAASGVRKSTRNCNKKQKLTSGDDVHDVLTQNC